MSSAGEAMIMADAYLKDPAAIYAQSFATVRAEAHLQRFPDDIAELVVRLIHACGMPSIADDIAFSPDAVSAGRSALKSGAPILVDANMVGAGIIRRHLSNNAIICALDDDGVAEDAKAKATTRSAVAVERWVPNLAGAVVAIGNAPTALFRCWNCWMRGHRRRRSSSAFRWASLALPDPRRR